MYEADIFSVFPVKMLHSQGSVYSKETSVHIWSQFLEVEYCEISSECAMLCWYVDCDEDCATGQ